MEGYGEAPFIGVNNWGSDKMKKVAFIDKCVEGPDDPNDTADRERFEENRRIMERLRERYDVVPYWKLNRQTYNMLKESSANEPYSGIITHVPGNPRYPEYVRMYGKGFKDLPQEERTEIFYGPSLAIIENIHQLLPEAVIIAYTGAGEDVLPDRRLETCGVRHVLRRGCRRIWDLPNKFDVTQILDWLDAEGSGL